MISKNHANRENSLAHIAQILFFWKISWREDTPKRKILGLKSQNKSEDDEIDCVFPEKRVENFHLYLYHVI